MTEYLTAASSALNAALTAVLFAIWWRRRTAFGTGRLGKALRSIGRHGVVASTGGHAPGDLAHAFNDVSRHLGLSIATQAALSQIDRTILGSLDFDEIARSTIGCLRMLTGADLVILVLNEMPSSKCVLVYAALADEPDRIERAELAAQAELLARIPAQPVLHWHGALPLPSAAEAQLKLRRASTAYSVFPISGSRQTRGAVVLGHPEPAHLSAEQLELIGDLIGRLRMACGTAERNRRLKELAHVDTLTGLPNRHALLQRLARALTNATENETRVAVLFLDLDRFKQVNDSLGHAAGDVLLRHAAERIRSNIRDGDTVARHGGDEFVLVLEGLGWARDASAVARQLITALSRRFEVEGRVVFVGASVGIAMFPDDGSDPSDLLRKADTAMYRAKADGRSRLAYFDEHMSVEAQRRATLDGDLRQAFARGEFLLYFQPLIELRTGRMRAVEALLRWRHPTQGLLAPDAFVPFAEETGLIDAIGTWVLKEACLQHQRWRAEGAPIPTVTVNVSIGQMRRSHFVRTVRSAMSAAGMSRGALEIEVTESIFLQGDSAANDAMNALAAAGVLFAIDDFGTGYSSFGNLTSVPAGVLKLDRSFLTGAAPGNERAAILAAMIGMAHALKKEVVAEGVENEEQLALLASLGCDIVQGFLLCRPLATDQVAVFARERLWADVPAARASQARPAPAAPTPRSVAPRDSDEFLTVPMSSD